VLLLVVASKGSAESPPVIQPTIASCSAQLTSESAVLDSSVNVTLARSTAVESPAFGTLTAGLGSNLTFAPEGYYLLWSFNPNTCIPEVQTLNIPFVSNSSNGLEKVVVSENPLGTEVTGASVQDSMMAETQHVSVQHGAGGNWGGYVFSTSEAVASQWTMPNVGASSGEGWCGASTSLVGACDISTWVGQSALAGNGQDGIAQAGTDSYVVCTWEAFYYDCVAGYDLWYDFYYGTGNNVCYSASAGDAIAANSSYSSSTTDYTVAVEDFTAHLGCSSSQNMEMGSPTFAQFTTENPPDPTFGGTFYEPTFGTIVFYPETIAAHQYAWEVEHTQYSYITKQSVGSMYNVTGHCQHPQYCTTNAFNVTYTG
jgi:hypothetical protein